MRLDQVDVWVTCVEAAHAVGFELMRRLSIPGLRVDAVPAGWDDATLLAESLAAVGVGYADADPENRQS